MPAAIQFSASNSFPGFRAPDRIRNMPLQGLSNLKSGSVRASTSRDPISPLQDGASPPSIGHQDGVKGLSLDVSA